MKDNVAAKITCDDRTLELVRLYPVNVLPGNWTAGIAYPTTWFDGPVYPVPERRMWISYLITECNECDPGIVISQTHPEVPKAELAQLQKEMQNIGPGRARDIAYALAVFQFDYQTNRDRLVKTQRECLNRPPDALEDDVCDGRLVQYLANLYWRGDNELLPILFGLAQPREDVVREAGTFYADLLDRRMDVALSSLSSISEEAQKTACAMAFDDDLRFAGPKIDRIESELRKHDTDVARRCLDTLQIRAAKQR